jgi:hypothetical protein
MQLHSAEESSDTCIALINRGMSLLTTCRSIRQT